MDKVQRAAEDLLLKCGCSPALNGFRALCTAVACVAEDPARIKNVCRNLYPLVGEKLGVRDVTIRQHMWNALDYIQDTEGHEVIMEALGLKPNPRTGRYTVRGFVGAAAIVIRREVETE